MNKLQKFLITLLGGQVPADKGLSLPEQEERFYANPTPSYGLDDTYMFDFKNYSAGSYSPILDTVDGKPKERIKMKPVDVLHELERVPSAFSMANLDDKITMLRDKSTLIKQSYAKREVDDLITRLENRKLYTENRQFFDQYDNTTDEKIDVLLEKYELVMKESDIFIPEFPADAIKLMQDYTEKMQEVFQKKPVFYVIAEEIHFKKSYQKRDPILLVQSPFGFYWQILGAWDKEMMLLSEL